MSRVSVLAPFYQTNPEPGYPSVDVVINSNIPAVRALHIEEMGFNPFPNKEVHSRLWTVGDKGEMDFMSRGANGANDYFNMCRPRYDKLKSMGIFHVSGPNEPLFWSLAELQAYNQFQVRLAHLLGTYGMHYWAWDWSVGWPDWGLSQHWIDSVNVARQTGGGLCVHMYGAPSVFRNEHYPDEHYALRVIRQIQELYQCGLKEDERWIIIGECGIDGGVIQWGQPPFNVTPRRGWREWGSWVYQTTSGPQVMNENLYWSQLSDYDDVLCGIPEIRYSFPFIAHPRRDWADFTITQYMLDSMADKYSQISIGEYLQQFIVPRNPAAAFERAALERDPGAVAVSPEIDYRGYRGQIFRFPGDYEWQHIFYSKIGDWGNIVYEQRRD